MVLDRARVGCADKSFPDLGGAIQALRGTCTRLTWRRPPRGAGTLTLNKLTVNQADVFPVSHIPHNEVRTCVVLRPGDDPAWAESLMGLVQSWVASCVSEIQSTWAPSSICRL